MSWPIPLEIPSVSPYLLETLSVLAYFCRDSKCFALFSLETLTLLAYSFRDSKRFALFNLETNFPGLFL